MNVKIHTPKSLKLGSGIATVKQFLLSLVATSISIVLTFGTAAWLDGRKKEEAKREMVMMILYDLSGAIEELEAVDSQLREGFEQQVKLAANPKLIEQNPFMFVTMMASIKTDDTETVERIFSSNIETINTLGNMLFTENVSDIYRLRRTYKEKVCDQFHQDVEQLGSLDEYDKIMKVDFPTCYIYLSGLLLVDMKEKYAQCLQMMDVGESDLEAYRQKRQEMTRASAVDSLKAALYDEVARNYQRIEEARKKAGQQP